jgi:hypothetical protein
MSCLVHLKVLTDQSLMDSSFECVAAARDLGTKSPLLCGPDRGMLLVAIKKKKKLKKITIPANVVK